MIDENPVRRQALVPLPPPDVRKLGSVGIPAGGQRSTLPVP